MIVGYLKSTGNQNQLHLLF